MKLEPTFFVPLLTKKITEEEAFKLGYDCGKSGANETNCNFNIFSRPENTAAWERGKKEANELHG